MLYTIGIDLPVNCTYSLVRILLIQLNFHKSSISSSFSHYSFILWFDWWRPMAGAVSALFILDIKGRCLLSRHYRGDISSVDAERFFTKLLENEVLHEISIDPNICVPLLLHIFLYRKIEFEVLVFLATKHLRSAYRF